MLFAPTTFLQKYPFCQEKSGILMISIKQKPYQKYLRDKYKP